MNTYDNRQGDNGGHSADLSGLSGEENERATYSTNSTTETGQTKAEDNSPAFSVGDIQKIADNISAISFENTDKKSINATTGFIGRWKEHFVKRGFEYVSPEEIIKQAKETSRIGHVSSATTIDIYSHITDNMQRQAAVNIDRKIGGTDAEMPRFEEQARKDDDQTQIEPYKPKIRRSGTGCVTMINDHLFEGRFSPRNAYGKREAHNIYAKTREECEEKLAKMIVEVKARIKADKDRLKMENESPTLETQ